MPLDLEMTLLQGNVETLVTDFVFDAKLGEATFSFEPPAGYTVARGSIDTRNASPQDVAEALRVWVGARGGTFPDSLTLNAYGKDGSAIEKALPQKEVFEYGQRISRLFILLQSNAAVRYEGRGVRLGQKDTPVFWYRPKGSKGMAVIYADLTVRQDVLESDLPASRLARPGT